MRPWLLLALACLPLACASSDGGEAPAASAAPDAALGLGTDPAVVARCLSCHEDAVGAAWAHGSSHRVLFDCDGCHHIGDDVPHTKAPALPTCDTCHSEVAHPAGAVCAGCHDPHGSANAFLVRERVRLPDGGSAPVHVGAAEGSSADGLVRQGSDAGAAGTGLCEVCHTATAHYRASGDAAAHATTFCGECHDHQRGFPPPDAGE